MNRREKSMKPSLNKLMITVLAVGGLAATGFADDPKVNPWNGQAGDGKWATAGNWNEGVPAAGQRAVITGGNTVTVSSETPATGSIVVGNGTAATLDMTGGKLTAETTHVSTYQGEYTATINLSGGQLDAGVLMVSANGDGSQSGVVNVSGGTLTFKFAFVGTTANGQFIIQGSKAEKLIGNNLQVGKTGELKFVLDANGVQKLYLNSRLIPNAGAKLTVDATAYKGNGPVTLVEAKGGNADTKLDGQFEAGNIQIIGRKGEVKQDPDTGEVSLMLEAP